MFLSRYAPSLLTILLGPAPPALPRMAQRCLLVLVGLHRTSYLAPAVMAGAAAPQRSMASDVVLLAAAVGWSAAFLIGSARTGRLRTGGVTADALVTGSLLLTAGAQPGDSAADSSSALWLTGIAQSCAVLLGAVARYPAALVMMAFLLAAQASATVPAAGGVASTLGPLVMLAAGAAVLARGAVPPGPPPRYRQVLHDGALATLTAIARGGLDHRSIQVRRRCARDADRIRRLLAGDLDGESDRCRTGVPGVLHEAADAAEALGVRVHLRVVDVPDELPPNLVDAVHGAVGEALTNVQRHAGTAEAWVTAVWLADRLRVTVVDRGGGFDAATAGGGIRSGGYGVQHSIVGRMAAAGGRATISSQPRSGTCVELSWPG